MAEGLVLSEGNCRSKTHDNKESRTHVWGELQMRIIVRFSCEAHPRESTAAHVPRAVAPRTRKLTMKASFSKHMSTAAASTPQRPAPTPRLRLQVVAHRRGLVLRRSGPQTRAAMSPAASPNKSKGGHRHPPPASPQVNQRPLASISGTKSVSQYLLPKAASGTCASRHP